MLNWLRRSPSDEFLASLKKFADSELARSKLPEYRMELEAYARSSFESEERSNMLQFISTSLQDTAWRPTFNCLNLLDVLFTKGSKSIITECHSGQYFDVLQRLLILHSYAHEDARVRDLVRDLSKSVRNKCKDKFAEIEDTATRDSLHEVSQSAEIPVKVQQEIKRLKRPQLHTGIHYIGHQEETSDEEDQGTPPKVSPAPAVTAVTAVTSNNLIDLL